MGKEKKKAQKEGWWMNWLLALMFVSYCGINIIPRLFPEWAYVSSVKTICRIILVACPIIIVVYFHSLFSKIKSDKTYQQVQAKIEEQRKRKQAKLSQMPEEQQYQAWQKKKRANPWIVGAIVCCCIMVLTGFVFAYRFPEPYSDYIMAATFGSMFGLLILGGVFGNRVAERENTTFFADKIRLAIQASGLDFIPLKRDEDWREQLAVIEWAVAHKADLLKRQEKRKAQRWRKKVIPVEALLTTQEKINIMRDAGFRASGSYLFKHLGGKWNQHKWYQLAEIDDNMELEEAQAEIKKEDRYGR